MAKQKTEVGKITIELKKGLMGCTEIQRTTALGLSLRRRNERRTLENTPSVRGMIKKVMHLLEVVEER